MRLLVRTAVPFRFLLSSTQWLCCSEGCPYYAAVVYVQICNYLVTNCNTKPYGQVDIAFLIIVIYKTFLKIMYEISSVDRMLMKSAKPQLLFSFKIGLMPLDFQIDIIMDILS